jgi:hypothetical protein
MNGRGERTENGTLVSQTYESKKQWAERTKRTAITVVLDDDVVNKLGILKYEKGKSKTRIINELVRAAYQQYLDEQ